MCKYEQRSYYSQKCHKISVFFYKSQTNLEKPHVEKKLCLARGFLSKLRYYALLSVLRSVYFGTAYPHLHYGITLWGKSAHKYITKVQVQQNLILKIMTKSFFETRLSPIYCQLNFLTLCCIFVLKVIKFVYKFKKRSLPMLCSTITSGPLAKHTITQLDLLWILTRL